MSTNHRIGKYELQELLGRGLTTEVWKAVDTQQNRYVAIKLFHPDLQADPDFVTRFLSEAQVIASLHHPNIVPLSDFQVLQARESGSATPYMVMDYVEGQTLADYISHSSRLGRFPAPAEVVRLLLPIAAAIDYAHKQGVVHHDIKPANILLGKQGPVLAGFSMVQQLKTSERSLTSAFYTAPEQAQGSSDNQRSDLYSLGVILYEIFTGTLPFDGDDPADILRQQIHATPTPPALINPNILPAVTAVIMRSLAKDPAIRYPSANTLLANLARALNIPLTEKPRQPGDPLDTMNSPTYIIPGGSVGMTPSSPSTRGSFPAPPPSALAASSVPAPFPDNISATVMPSVQPTIDLPKSMPTRAQSGGPVTPILPLLTPERFAPPLPPAKPPRERSPRRLLIALLVLLIIALIGSVIGAYLVLLPRGNNTVNTLSTIPPVGHAFFISSGLLSPNPASSQGITDQLQLNLQKIAPPQPDKGYYAWLLNDKRLEWKPLYLGKLTFNPDGTSNLTYTGDAEHTDLLASNSRFLITEGDAGAPPPSPSLDPSTWLYYAEFSQRPDPADPAKYSLYDHIRHLLAADPKLQEIGLTGGLDIWLFRNTQKILEWSGSVRDAWKNKNAANAAFMRRQLTRILAYLDGTTYLQRDLPGVQAPVDPTIAKVALLEFDVQKQEPPGYLYHIGTRHLHSMIQLSDTTPGQKTLAIQISKAIDNVNIWLRSVHDDALKLYKMTDDQLLGNAGRILLDDLATQANNAFIGQINPFTHQVKEGVVQIHYNIQRLATFDIRQCAPSHPCSL